MLFCRRLMAIDNLQCDEAIGVADRHLVPKDGNGDETNAEDGIDEA